MKTRLLATLLLAVVSLFGLMSGTSSAKVITTVGAVDVPRTTVLNVFPVSQDTALYAGFVSIPPAQISVMAKRRVVRKSAAAAGDTGRAAPIKKKPKKRGANLPSKAQQGEAKLQAEELCTGFTRLTLLEVIHLSNPPFLLGRAFPQLGYSFASDRPPPGDLVRAQQVGTDFGGAAVVTTGPFRWTVSCSAVQATVQVT